MPKITPFLWFDDNAEEAMAFYASIFKNTRIGSVSRYGDGGHGPKGQVMSGTIEIEGQTLMVLNGGPHYKLTEAFSLHVSCETQEEVDDLWEKLSAGGSKGRCGWLIDRFGLSWQIIPTALPRLMQSGDAARSQRVMQAMLGMNKLDIAGLERAHAGE